MDSLDRIFGFINEAKKAKKKKGMVGPTPKGKANRYDHDSFGMKAESKIPVQKPPPKGGKYKPKPPPKDIWIKRKIKEDVVQILGLLKEAYEDELISEEAFLAIADPIMRSLVEGRSVNFPDTYEMEDLDDAEEEGTPKLSPKQREIAKVAGNPKKIGADDLAALRKKGKKK